MPEEAQAETPDAGQIPGSEYDIQDPEEVALESVTDTDAAPEGDDVADDTAEETTSTKPVFDDELLARARAAGLGDDVDNFPSAQSLRNVLDAFEKDRSGGAEESVDTRGEDGFTLPDDLADYDPKMAEVMQNMKAHYDKVIAEMRESLGGVVASEQKRTEAARRAHFDSLVEALDAPTKKALFADDKDGRANRDSLYEEVDIMREGYVAKGKTPPSEQELFNRALRGKHSSELKALDEKKLRASINKRQNQFISRTTGRDGVNESDSPRAKALRAVSAKMTDMGWETVGVETDEDLADEFL